jgi:aryl-alcohol dehydrogenase-like predicted oxidoreductase
MHEMTKGALGAWSGGLVMRFGLAIEEDRLVALLRPDERINAVVTADVYGQGEADRLVGRAIGGLPRGGYRLVGAVGHDFYTGERDGPRGFPRFTDPRLREPKDYAAYLRMATEASLERCGVDGFDLLLLHNPDRVGYTSEAVWRGMTDLRDEGLTQAIGLAPGPANGFTLDILCCLERFGAEIEWAMLILNPFEPWPGSLALPACKAHDVNVLARVVDYGGVFHGDVPDEDQLADGDHRTFRPAGWVADARARLDEVRPIADAHGLTPLQLASIWTLQQPAVEAVVPTLIQEPGADAKPVEDKREELAGLPEVVLSHDEMATIATVGDNTGCMTLKGASPEYESERADAWPLNEELVAIGARWGVNASSDLVRTA